MTGDLLPHWEFFRDECAAVPPWGNDVIFTCPRCRMNEWAIWQRILCKAGKAAGSRFYMERRRLFFHSFCHKWLERVINSNCNYAKPSPPLPVPGWSSTSRDNPSPGAVAGSWHCETCRCWLPKEMPKYGGKFIRGFSLIWRCFAIITSWVSVSSPNQNYRIKRLNLSFGSVKPGWLP